MNQLEQIDIEESLSEHTVSDSNSNNNIETKESYLITALAYFPLIGWILPLYLDKESNFNIANIKNGIALSSIAVTASTLFLFMKFSFFFNNQIIVYSMAAIIYSFYAVYLLVSLAGFFKTLKGNKFAIPAIKKYIDRIEI